MKYYIPAFIWALIIAALSVAPGSSMPETLQDLLSSDKLAHAAAYFGLAALLSWAAQRGRRQRRWQWPAALWSAAYGVAMEVIQVSFFPYRHFEVLDMLANAIGAVLAIIVFRFLF